ncbi:MAG: hypothetical protein ACFFCE_20125, partial [Promethearchaeota archaeon]
MTVFAFIHLHYLFISCKIVQFDFNLKIHLKSKAIKQHEKGFTMRFLNTNKFRQVLVVILILAFVVPTVSSAMVSSDTQEEPQTPNPKPNSFSTGPQVPLGDPNPFWVNFYDTTVSTAPNYPNGWAQAVDGNMNYYSYRGFIIPNVLTVVDEYYFHAAPIEHWGHSIQDIKIRISLNAYLWNWDLGFCNISIK